MCDRRSPLCCSKKQYICHIATALFARKFAPEGNLYFVKKRLSDTKSVISIMQDIEWQSMNLLLEIDRLLQLLTLTV